MFTESVTGKPVNSIVVFYFSGIWRLPVLPESHAIDEQSIVSRKNIFKKMRKIPRGELQERGVVVKG